MYSMASIYLICFQVAKPLLILFYSGGNNIPSWFFRDKTLQQKNLSYIIN